MSRYKIERYKGVKSVFQAIAVNTQGINATFTENEEVLALSLKIEKNDEHIDYYYIHGNIQVIRFVNNEDYKVMTTDPEKLGRHISWDIEDFMKGKAIA